MKHVSAYLVPVFRTGFSDDGEEAGRAAGLLCSDVSLAVQDPKEDVDINKIMSRYVVSGVAPQHTRVPLEGDFGDIIDYRSALEAVERARESFMSLDPKVRARFNQDPGVFVDFCMDPANLPEMRKLGLAVPLEEPPPPPPPAA